MELLRAQTGLAQQAIIQPNLPQVVQYGSLQHDGGLRTLHAKFITHILNPCPHAFGVLSRLRALALKDIDQLLEYRLRLASERLFSFQRDIQQEERWKQEQYSHRVQSEQSSNSHPQWKQLGYVEPTVAEEADQDGTKSFVREHSKQTRQEHIVRDQVVTSSTVSYTHLRAHETRHDLVCRLLLE